MTRVFLLFIMLISAKHHIAYTQLIEFTYDNSGNRILRQLVIGGNAAAQSIFDEGAQRIAAGVEVKEPVEDVVNELKVKIYPNPTRGQLVVELLNPNPTAPAQIAVYDMGGRLVLISQNPGDFTNLDLSNQAVGVYVLRITSGEHSINWRIVKQ